MQPTVYLAGPITGLSFQGCTNWRDYAIKRLAEHGIRGLSPMRGKEYLSHLATISGHARDYADLGVLSAPRAIITRDRWDATRCDVVLAHLAGATQVSIGTVMEIAWADLKRIPLVVTMECGIRGERLSGQPVDNPHDHCMIHEATGFRVATLEEALDVTIAILK